MGCNDRLENNSSSNQREHTRYFAGQLVTAGNLNQDLKYQRDKRRLHNRLLHGWGVVCGFEVRPGKITGPSLVVTICPGYALSPQGDEIYVPTEVQFDLAQCLTGPASGQCKSSCSPVASNAVDATAPFYIAIKYAECLSHPVRVPPVGCGCDDTACEYSRIREGFEVSCITDDKLPKTYFDAPSGEAEGNIFPCPTCLDVPWVVIAKVSPGDTEGVYNIDHFVRRILLSTSKLQSLGGY